jgi:4-hydroxybenzoate polyprenyltransferase
MVAWSGHGGALAPLQGSLSSLRRLARWHDWSDSKLPLFVAAMCYSVLRMEAPGIVEAVEMTALLLLLCLYAAFGHIVNDYADRDADRTAGKKKLLAQWSEPAALTAVALPAVGTVAAAWILFDLYTLALTLSAVLVAAVYSLPPARLKERGFLGWAAATGAQRTLPLAIIFQAFEAWDGVAVLMTALNTLIGIRYIAVHQLRDRQNDRRSGVRTVATERRPEQLIPLLRALFGLEAACACAAAAVTSYVEPPFAVAVLAYAASLVIWRRRGIPLSPISYNAFSTFYSAVWPLGLALLVAVENPVFVPALLLAIILMDNSTWLSARALLATRAMPSDQTLTAAKTLIAAGKSHEAKQLLFPAVVAKAPSIDLLIAFGESCIRCRDLDGAFGAYHRALALKPQWPLARNELGVANHLMGNFPVAISCFEEVLVTAPNFRNAYVNLAQALREAERHREALTCLERALVRWPGFVRAAELRRVIAKETGE